MAQTTDAARDALNRLADLEHCTRIRVGLYDDGAVCRNDYVTVVASGTGWVHDPAAIRRLRRGGGRGPVAAMTSLEQQREDAQIGAAWRRLVALTDWCELLHDGVAYRVFPGNLNKRSYPTALQAMNAAIEAIELEGAFQ